MHHITIAIPGGYAVAYHRPTGELCAVSEHSNRKTADLQAQQLNAQYQALIAKAHAARHRQHAFAERRPVRWFEPDAFA